MSETVVVSKGGRRYSREGYEAALGSLAGSSKPLSEVVHYDYVYGVYAETVQRSGSKNEGRRPGGTTPKEFDVRMQFEGYAEQIVKKIKHWRDEDLGFNHVIHVDKGEGRTRPIEIMSMENQLMSSVALKHVEERIALPEEFFCVPRGGGKGLHEAVFELARQSVGKTILKLDIRGFFENVPHDRVRSILSDRWCQDDIDLVMALTTIPGRTRGGQWIRRENIGLSQGNPLSQYLALLTISHLPDALGEEVDSQIYYADDFGLIFGGEETDPEYVLEKVGNELGIVGLQLKTDCLDEVLFGADEEVYMLGMPLRAVQTIYINFLNQGGSDDEFLELLKDPIAWNEMSDGSSPSGLLPGILTHPDLTQDLESGNKEGPYGESLPGPSLNLKESDVSMHGDNLLRIRREIPNEVGFAGEQPNELVPVGGREPSKIAAPARNPAEDSTIHLCVDGGFEFTPSRAIRTEPHKGRVADILREIGPDGIEDVTVHFGIEGEQRSGVRVNNVQQVLAAVLHTTKTWPGVIVTVKFHRTDHYAVAEALRTGRREFVRLHGGAGDEFEAVVWKNQRERHTTPSTDLPWINVVGGHGFRAKIHTSAGHCLPARHDRWIREAADPHSHPAIISTITRALDRMGVRATDVVVKGVMPYLFQFLDSKAIPTPNLPYMEIVVNELMELLDDRSVRLIPEDAHDKRGVA